MGINQGIVWTAAHPQPAHVLTSQTPEGNLIDHLSFLPRQKLQTQKFYYLGTTKKSRIVLNKVFSNLVRVYESTCKRLIAELQNKSIHVTSTFLTSKWLKTYHMTISLIYLSILMTYITISRLSNNSPPPLLKSVWNCYSSFPCLQFQKLQ